MSRTIVRFQQVPAPAQASGFVDFFYLEDAPPPANHPRARSTLTPLALNSTSGPFPTLRHRSPSARMVANAGNALTQELNRNVYVQGAVANLCNPPAGAGKRPLFVELCNSDLAEDLPWETLFHAGASDFLACRAPSPVGRLAGGNSLAPRWLDLTALDQRPVLRVLAVLAADQVPARGEWDALYAAKQQAGQTRQFEIELAALVSEQSLLNYVQTKSMPVDYLASRKTIAQKIALFRPHIIHFFCHGSTAGSPSLVLTPSKGPQISYTASELLNDLQTEGLQLWMAVLNCCGLGQAVAGNGSFARNLVGPEVGVVVGMAEPISSQFAHAFCRAYYDEIVTTISRHFPAPGSLAAVEWVEATVRPRRTLLEDQTRATYSAQLAGDHKEWSLPVFYTVSDAFRFGISNQTGTQTSAAQALVNQLAPVLLKMPELPAPVRSRVESFLPR